MEKSPKIVVDKMLTAFIVGDVDAILETVSEDTVWIYHGTPVIPKGEYRGKSGVRKFFTSILKETEVIKFEPERFIVQDNIVVILGKTGNGGGRELKAIV